MVQALIALTKPRIIELLLVTTIPAMVLAERGWPSWGLVLLTLVGGTLAAGSANTINCYVDRDIDAVMKRTSRRPLAQAKTLVSPVEALRFGILLGVGSTCLFGFAVNWPSALLADGAIAVLRLRLHPRAQAPDAVRTSSSAAPPGCFPVLIGWSAVTGDGGLAGGRAVRRHLLLDPAALLGAGDEVQATTTPPPGCRCCRWSPDATTVARQITFYSYAMVATSLLLVPIGHAGWLYLGVAIVLGLMFLREAHQLQRRVARGENPKPMRLFHWSITYLTLLFAAVAVGQFTF